MAVHGKYGMQVYSIRDIKCGEELSFDYNSVTEDEQEWKQAVCLCGMKSCRGYYLAYSGSDSYTDVLYKQYHALHRTAVSYRACCSNGDGSEFNDDSKQAQDLFVKRSLGNSVLRGIPVWMKLFLLHILQYIELEDKLLPLELMKLDLTNKYSLKDAEEETFGIKRTRIQNLVLTLVCFLFFNKTKFFFRNGKNARQIHIPPLQVLESELLVKKIGLKVTVSFRICGFDALTVHLGRTHPLTARVHEMNPCLAKDVVAKSKQYLEEIRDELRKLKPTPFAYHHAAADCIDFYLHTKYWFAAHNYESFKSKVFTLKELGYNKGMYIKKGGRGIFVRSFFMHLLTT
ncbi:hypothetical protein RFI_29493 [Reticulomyxa filosa]|uniref:Post-SET domain-containing protein n=1 Tax=Reticulomyxa filosa TaxID=46433 RepID=X6M359_RETFI|nr:hypothetical protein RFI_29493 [Reticulomyxa filosa]|eukprot:ETO07897.1 hypothetical protein RFI_29493 [Reticulomyxa filosa]